MLFLAKGWFRLDTSMISNPYLSAMWYDPYGKALMDEWCDTKAMKTIRRGGIEAASSPDSIYF